MSIKEATRPTQQPFSSRNSQRVHSPCLKKGFFSGINELLSSIEIHEAANGTYIVFYIIVKFGESINEISNAIFDSIERDFEMFSLVKPVEIKACIKGVQAEHLTRRDVEVIRTNE